MVSIDNTNLSSEKSVVIKKIKKSNLLIDMTPMVDLGFLLITFFIFTTTMNTPVAMDLIVPKDNIDGLPVSKDGVLTILLDEKNAFFYNSDHLDKIQSIDYKEIRNVINQKKQECSKKNILNKFMIIIKPTKNSNYQQTINILDEMEINDIKRYALVDVEKKEYNLLKTKFL